MNSRQMTAAELILNFVIRAADDPKLGPLHISLYLAIVLTYEQQGCKSPISVQSRDLMRLAKIASTCTYHKYMRDLKMGNYIGYVPSYNPALGSLIYLESAASKDYVNGEAEVIKRGVIE